MTASQEVLKLLQSMSWIQVSLVQADTTYYSTEFEMGYTSNV